MEEPRIELEIKIDEVWLERNWAPTAINNPKANRILPFVRSVHFKLYQAAYHLENTLSHELKAQNFRNGGYIDNSKITKYEFDALIHALNSVKDILAKLIILVYDINTSKKVYFSTIFGEEPNRHIYEQLEQKKPALLTLLSNFNKTDEREIVSEYCNNIKHQDALITGAWINSENNVDIVTPILPDSGERKRIRDLAPKLEKAHREILCTAGQLLIPDLGYKREIEFPRDHRSFSVESQP